jgi:hypothetical protein
MLFFELNIISDIIIQGAGWLGKNDITWGKANSPSMLVNQKVNKVEELSYFYTNTGKHYLWPYICMPVV